MLNAAALHETAEGLMVLAMAKAAGVTRFVYRLRDRLGQSEISAMGPHMFVWRTLAPPGDVALMSRHHAVPAPLVRGSVR